MASTYTVLSAQRFGAAASVRLYQLGASRFSVVAFLPSGVSFCWQFSCLRCAFRFFPLVISRFRFLCSFSTSQLVAGSSAPLIPLVSCQCAASSQFSLGL